MNKVKPADDSPRRRLGGVVIAQQPDSSTIDAVIGRRLPSARVTVIIQAALAALAVAVSACGGGSSGTDDSATADAPTTAIATTPLSVDALLDGGPLTGATVSGFVVWDPSGARLCDVLMESFPPQCGGAAVSISDPDSLRIELEQEQSVRWTNDPVQLVGDYDGTRLMLAS